MVTFAVLRMRGGRLVSRDLYRVRSLKDEEEILPEFLMACYTDPLQVPPSIFVPSESGLALAERWFAEELGVETRIEAVAGTDSGEAEARGETGSRAEAADAEITASGGAHNASSGTTENRHRAAMAMARFNAREDARRRLREHGDFPALEELRSLLGLPRVPSRIEGFDIAHIGGRLPVASLITFKDGNPDRKNYRIFRLKTTDGVIDDFASMREAATRRYTRLMNEGEICRICCSSTEASAGQRHPPGARRPERRYSGHRQRSATKSIFRPLRACFPAPPLGRAQTLAAGSRRNAPLRHNPQPKAQNQGKHHPRLRVPPRNRAAKGRQTPGRLRLPRRPREKSRRAGRNRGNRPYRSNLARSRPNSRGRPPRLLEEQARTEKTRARDGFPNGIGQGHGGSRPSGRLN